MGKHLRGSDGLLGMRVPEDNLTDARLKVVNGGRQAENRHQLGRGRDIKAILYGCVYNESVTYKHA